MRAKVTLEKINKKPLLYDHLYFLSSILYAHLSESNVHLPEFVKSYAEMLLVNSKFNLGDIRSKAYEYWDFFGEFWDDKAVAWLREVRG